MVAARATALREAVSVLLTISLGLNVCQFFDTRLVLLPQQQRASPRRSAPPPSPRPRTHGCRTAPRWHGRSPRRSRLW